MIAVQERPLVLHCRVEGEPPVSISWHKDGAALGNDSHTAVLANGSLRIESFHRRPRGGGAANQTSVGDYSCAAQNRDGLLISRKARVQLASESGPGTRQPTARLSVPRAMGQPSRLQSPLVDVARGPSPLRPSPRVWGAGLGGAGVSGLRTHSGGGSQLS